MVSLGIGVALVPGAVVGVAASRPAGRALVRLGPSSALAVSAALAALALVLSALGAAASVTALLVVGVAVVTVAFGLGQPALVAAVSAAVPVAQRGVALGTATLVFLVGGGFGSAAVGGLRAPIGMVGCLLALAALAVAGASAALLLRRRPADRVEVG